MDFSEKISIILKTNKLQLVTKEELAEYCGFHRDTIRKAIDRGSELKNKNLRIFQDKLSINPEWWDKGKGDIYLGNHTHEPKPNDNKEMEENGTPFKTMKIDGNDYLLVPKMLMQDKHRITSVEQMQKDTRIIDSLLENNMKLYKELSELKSQLPTVQKTK